MHIQKQCCCTSLTGIYAQYLYFGNNRRKALSCLRMTWASVVGQGHHTTELPVCRLTCEICGTLNNSTKTF